MSFKYMPMTKVIDLHSIPLKMKRAIGFTKEFGEVVTEYEEVDFKAYFFTNGKRKNKGNINVNESEYTMIARSSIDIKMESIIVYNGMEFIIVDYKEYDNYGGFRQYTCKRKALESGGVL